jgi:hypothetical protein
VLLAAALVAGTLYWLGRGSADEGSGPPELIKAEPGPIKIKPENPGGIDVAGDSETAFATGAGEQVDGQLNLDAVPEQPIARPEPQAAQPHPPNRSRQRRSLFRPLRRVQREVSCSSASTTMWARPMPLGRRSPAVFR